MSTMPSTNPANSSSTSTSTPITVATGDGIGPEIMDATLRVLEAAGARLDIEKIDIGEKVYLSGQTSGICADAWESLRRTRVFLKAPITTPQGGGYKSLNVTIRKTLGLYANVRPCATYSPFVATKHPNMDVIIIRENEEDTYAGIEHQQTDEVYQCLKLITRPGCERICRYAFEYAAAHGRKKVTCFTKDNIMKLTDGLFHRVFDEVGAEYPDIEKEHWIIDIGAARLADTPEMFDVIVMPNLYGDVVSDIAAQISGSVGLAGSANIGEGIAMFEAIHGSAPPIAGQNIANPSGLLHAALQMLVHIGQPDVAESIHNAWLATIEEGIHTFDIFNEANSTKQVGTSEFADAVIERLGRRPSTLTAVSYAAAQDHPRPAGRVTPTKSLKKETIGVDVFLHWRGQANDLGAQLEAVSCDTLRIKMITNRGVKVWPDGFSETFCTDHWRCRFVQPDQKAIAHADITNLLNRIAEAGLDFIKTENLCTFDGQRAYSLGQGE